MADVEERVNMSLDDIIKMDKKKKINTKAKRGGGPGGPGGPGGAQRGRRGRSTTRGNMRGNGRGNMQRNRSRSRSRPRQNGNPMFNVRRGQWRRYPQIRGGQMRRYNNIQNNSNHSNLTRSRSNMSLNRMNMNNHRGNRGGYGPRRGGRFSGGLTRSRSRTNLTYNKPTFMVNKSRGFLKRTSSMPNLSDPSSVYNRLGYQSPAQIAYRNRVKRAKSVLLQKSKVMRMANALMLTPPRNSMSPKQPHRRNSIGSLHSDQILRAQRRAQYENKLFRANVVRANPAALNFYNTMNAAYAPMQPHPAMALYPSTIQNNSIGISQRQMQRRGRSPFRKSIQPVKQEPGFQRSRSARRNRSRSRSRSRPAPSRRNSVINLMDNDYEDRSFSEVMYSLSGNFGITKRTLNDRFSLF